MTRALVLALAACGAPAATARKASDAVVVITSNVRDAQLYVDGRFVAPLDALHGGVALEPGPHRLELRREDYFARYAELTLARSQRARLVLDLAPILP